jgi:hypothetical protein
VGAASVSEGCIWAVAARVKGEEAVDVVVDAVVAAAGFAKKFDIDDDEAVVANEV